MRVIALMSQCIALLDAKPVLLINDDQAQPRKVYILLNQGKRADSNRGLPILDSRTSYHALTRAQAACKQNGTNAKWLQHDADTLGVLFRKQFGRCHYGPLKAVECGHDQCCCRYSRFAR